MLWVQSHSAAHCCNLIFHDLSSLFNIMQAAVKAKIMSTIDPLEFVAKLPSMPALLVTDKAGLNT